MPTNRTNSTTVQPGVNTTPGYQPYDGLHVTSAGVPNAAAVPTTPIHRPSSGAAAHRPTAALAGRDPSATGLPATGLPAANVPHGTFGGDRSSAPLQARHSVPLPRQRPTEAEVARILKHAHAGCATCQAYIVGAAVGRDIERRRADREEDRQKRERLQAAEHGRSVSRAADRAGLAAVAAEAPFDPTQEDFAQYIARMQRAKGRAETAARRREGGR